MGLLLPDIPSASQTVTLQVSLDIIKNICQVQDYIVHRDTSIIPFEWEALFLVIVEHQQSELD